MDKVIQALESKNLLVGKKSCLSIFARKSSVQSLPARGRGRHGSCFVPREEWPKHRFFGVPVAFDGSQRVMGVGREETCLLGTCRF